MVAFRQSNDTMLDKYGFVIASMLSCGIMQFVSVEIRASVCVGLNVYVLVFVCLCVCVRVAMDDERTNWLFRRGTTEMMFQAVGTLIAAVSQNASICNRKKVVLGDCCSAIASMCVFVCARMRVCCIYIYACLECVRVWIMQWQLLGVSNHLHKI